MSDPKTLEVSDAEWVELARRGDAQAFDALVRRHQRSLYAFCRRLTGDHHQADEIAQEAFVRAYFGLRHFRSESRFGTWLRQIALNLVRSSARHRRRTTEIEDPDALAAPQPEAGQGVEDPMRRRRLEAAVRALPEKQRRALILKIFDDMTHAEAAQALGCTVGTVKANLFHALRKMRALLGEEG